MLIRTPDYYEQFKCIADKCTDTCCAGWQVDVDDRSFAYYKTITGPFGDRLKSVMVDAKKGAEGQFRIREDGRCPFLNDCNLCDLYTELGEDALCVTCEQYPRYTTEYGNVREIGIALSCITAAEIILSHEGTAQFSEREDSDATFSLNSIDGMLYLALTKARERAYEIVTDGKSDIRSRMINLLCFSEGVQRYINDPDRIKEYVKEYVPGEIAGRFTENSKAYLNIWKHYLKQVIIKKEWVDLYRDCEKMYSANDYADAIGITGEYAKEYENILVYFVYRYFLKACMDRDVLTKAKTAVVGTLMIIHCHMALWKKNGGELSFAERVDAAHLYSRELEHSEENFARMAGLYRRKKIFSVKNLIKLI